MLIASLIRYDRLVEERTEARLIISECMLIASLIRYDRLVEERTEARLIIGYVDAEEARALETALEQRRVDEVTHELRREQRRRGAQLGAWLARGLSAAVGAAERRGGIGRRVGRSRGGRSGWGCAQHGAPPVRTSSNIGVRAAAGRIFISFIFRILIVKRIGSI